MITQRRPAEQRQPSLPMVVMFWGVLLVNLLLVHLAFERESYAGGDAAGMR